MAARGQVAAVGCEAGSLAFPKAGDKKMMIVGEDAPAMGVQTSFIPLNTEEGGAADGEPMEGGGEGFSFQNEEFFTDRSFTVDFVFTGEEALENPDVLTEVVPMDRKFIFQKGHPAYPGDMAKRRGKVDNVIVRDIRLARVSSDFPVSMGLVISDRAAHDEPFPSIRGKTYTFSGKRFPYVIFPKQKNDPNKIIHAAERDTEDLIQAYGDTTEESLLSTLMTPPKGPDQHEFIFVPHDHKVIEVCRKNEETVGFKVDEMPLVDDQYYKLSAKFVTKICDKILSVAQDIAPFNMEKMEVRLVPTKEDGFRKTLEKLTRGDASLMDAMKERPYQVTMEFEVAYAPIDPEEDEDEEGE